MKLLLAVGARPNFVKASALVHALAEAPDVRCRLVHTGQHREKGMSAVFFRELGLPRPAALLDAGSSPPAARLKRIAAGFAPHVRSFSPDWVVVFGDVDSTLACALAARKERRRVAHVEAGLRCWDMTMPEERNRVRVDHLSDILFTPSREAGQNLLKEGIHSRKIRFVGNVMIDTLKRFLPQTGDRPILDRLGLRRAGAFVLATLHRPANVDEPAGLRLILEALCASCRGVPLLLPVHPRCRPILKPMSRLLQAQGARLVEPLGYLDFICLMRRARLVVTDSGGVQEESSYLGVPCLTLRPSTERPLTVEAGTNELVSAEPAAVRRAVAKALKRPAPMRPRPPALWDGEAAARIVSALRET